MTQNAIKFSQEGGRVKIAIEYLPVKDHWQNVGVKISVRDWGIGISPEDRKNLFKMYFKTSDKTSATMNRLNHGIGLSVCKQLAKAMNGDLTFNENVMDGTEFELFLTLQKFSEFKEENVLRGNPEPPDRGAKQKKTLFKFGQMGAKKRSISKSHISEYEDILPVFEVDSENSVEKMSKSQKGSRPASRETNSPTPSREQLK